MLREYYLKKLAQGKPKEVAVVAIIRRLVCMVYSILKNEAL